MTLVLVVLALMAVLLVVAGGDISQEAWIEGCLLAALLIGGCVVFAWYAASHHW